MCNPSKDETKSFARALAFLCVVLYSAYGCVPYYNSVKNFTEESHESTLSKTGDFTIDAIVWVAWFASNVAIYIGSLVTLMRPSTVLSTFRHWHISNQGLPHVNIGQPASVELVVQPVSGHEDEEEGESAHE